MPEEKGGGSERVRSETAETRRWMATEGVGAGSSVLVSTVPTGSHGSAQPPLWQPFIDNEVNLCTSCFCCIN